MPRRSSSAMRGRAAAPALPRAGALERPPRRRRRRRRAGRPLAELAPRRERGVDHVVLERDRARHAWREERWDAFTLVTPNWQCRLPGHPVRRRRPRRLHGARRDRRATSSGYAAHVRPAAARGRRGRRACRAHGERLRRRDERGDADAPTASCWRSAATTRRRCRRSPSALPRGVTQLHSRDYRNARVAARRRGARRRHRAVGRADRRGPAPRRPRRSTCASATRRGSPAATAAATSSRGCDDMRPLRTCRSRSTREGHAARKEANHYVTGRDGGRDIDLRAFAREGMRLHGRLARRRRRTASRRSPATCGERSTPPTRPYNRINASDRPVDRGAGHRRTAEEPRYVPVWEPPPDGSAPLDLAPRASRASSGARASARTGRWVDLPFLDATGYPDHERGVTHASPASSSSACRGCTRGARAASPRSRRTRSIVAEHLAARSAVVRAA